MKQPIIIGFDDDEGRSGGVDLAALMRDVAAELEADGMAVKLEPRHTDNRQQAPQAELDTEAGED